MDNQTNTTAQKIRVRLVGTLIGKDGPPQRFASLVFQKQKLNLQVLPKQKVTSSVGLEIPLASIKTPSVTSSLLDLEYAVELECLDKPFLGFVIRKPILILFKKSP
eukprot:TRINITY_DN279_c0_g1_i2.p2 TRINITY_DN279_c0_g1~~TRINITY_DN279_c0_g1_i2.p2  ORF type:complete len:106 (+),score=0.27 TRINITY_DN279_c0_g1_i2:3-320(+)